MINFNPQSILDVGCGSGKYGLLARDYLENRQPSATYKGPYDWKLRIDAIEIFLPYVSALHGLVYNHVFDQDALQCVKAGNEYDLILCIDMIEHCTKAYGIELIREMIDHSWKGVIVSTPDGPMPQESVFGNERERHVSEWTAKDFTAIDDRCSVFSAGGVYTTGAERKFLIAIYDKESSWGASPSSSP